MESAVIYARYSSDNQREESITAQIRAIKEWAKREKYNIIDIYKDEAQSATTDDRKDFLRMIDDSKEGLFNAVIVHKLDRFARNRYDSAFYKRQLKLNGVKVISILENLDDSPESIILESVLEGMAEYYSANLAREVKKGMRETALQAKHTGGNPPLGYDVGQDKTLIINEHEAIAVKIIYTMYSNGYSYGDIINELNSNGFKTKANKPFGKNSLYEILRQEKYTGTYVYNRRVKGLNGKYNNHKKKPNNEIIRIENGCPQIIKKEEWLKVQERMNGNKKIGGQNTAKVDYLLSGKIFCGKCGAAMTGHGTSDSSTKTRYYYYVCNNKKRTKQCDLKGIRKDDIEAMVLDHLWKYVFCDEMIEKSIDKIYAYANKKKEGVPNLLKSYQDKLSEINNSIDKVIELLMSGYKNASLKERLDGLEQEKKELENLIIKTELKLNKVDYTREEISTFMYAFKNFRSMPAAQQKKVINMFVYRVVIYEDKYDMEIFNNPIDSNKNKKFRQQRGTVHPDHRQKELNESLIPFLFFVFILIPQ
ncbi:site-specific DNA recombinase [Tissierella praeacuta DSM 18095]|uniref:Site-specific DNA recombinase n=1 Tax=Tissierella praeacuta DSM 18095 TaxID=1123404 RepID=A0A1M4WF77_9FIRM|nr:recombinase family protein [Tissierella praeacuta]SHE79951.1 site-specific DNA recombinase [Tissierella praeacuta DSM 18095]SUO99480.1 Transposase and inactivated derivatives [Tissierella praeacuta]